LPLSNNSTSCPLASRALNWSRDSIVT
jgi:hypothetical protein